jgi:rare lipoprotein A
MKRAGHPAAGPALLALLLSACAGAPTRPAPVAESPRAAARPTAGADAPSRDSRSAFVRACAPTREHRDSDYTPGGLYAPGVSDAGPAQPIDVSAVREPVPREEPRARSGNRSPYTVLGRSYEVLDSAHGFRERGLASWYGTKFNGRATSSGELYDICAFTAAHKTLPLPSYVRVTNLDNGRSLVVRVNDRGPFHEGRVMDLSYAAAVRLGVDRAGTARVQLEAVGPGDGDGRPAPVAPEDENVAAATEAAAPLSSPTRRWSPPAPSIAGDDATFQLGSFGERDNARRLADRLRDAGIEDVDIDHVELDGRDLWRVRVGPVPAGELGALRERLRALELPEPRVVSD